MHCRIGLGRAAQLRASAFTIVEAVVALGVIGVLVVALYAGMTTATFSVRLARENLRATEVMVEKMEGLRLYSWDQLLTEGYIPTNFIAYYYDQGSTNGVGITYTGTVTVARFPFADRNYSNDMRKVTVTVDWTSGGIGRSRTLDTYMARYGIQNYVIQ